jgi:hypothetical protein
MPWKGGRKLQVQPIQDHPRSGRIQVPARLVSYVLGSTRHKDLRRVSTTRRYATATDQSEPNDNVSQRTEASSKTSKAESDNKAPGLPGRITRDDVDRLSKGQPAKRKGSGSRNVPHRLNAQEQEGLVRAARKGYVSLHGATGFRRTRGASPLANIHRQWCDARAKPQIMLFKAVSLQDEPLDRVVVDASPLRLPAAFLGPDKRVDVSALVEEALQPWRDQVAAAAANAGMVLEQNSRTGNSNAAEQDNDDEDQSSDAGDASDDNDDTVSVLNVPIEIVKNDQVWANEPVWKLPFVSLGSFVGSRNQAKAMAKELAELWEIPEKEAVENGGPANRREAGAKKGGKTKMKGISQHRTRGGGHRQSFY